MRPDQRLPQACVVAVGLLFGVLLAGLSTHLHARELAALRGTLHQAQASRAAAEAELSALRRQVTLDTTFGGARNLTPASPQLAPLPLPVLHLPHPLETDLFLRNLGGSPNDDPAQTQRFLLALSVGAKQLSIVDSLVSKFDLRDFVIVLFHYDGRLDAWNELPWASKAIHVCVAKQSKWWFARRFLHPSVVGHFELVFVWDEDIGGEHFDAARYVEIVQSRALDISQPSIGAGPVSWPITRRVPGVTLHRCLDDVATPCVEVMVPVFSSRAWHCIWHMLPNDLVHVFGLDLAWHVCAGNITAMAIIDEVSVEHLGAPTLGEGQSGENGHAQPAWMSVNARRHEEWRIWSARWDAAQQRARLDNVTAGRAG